MQKRHGDRVVVLTLAVESDEDQVKKIAAEINLPVRWVMRTPDLLAKFGDVSAVPTMLVFDGRGRLAGSHYGASPTLHQEAEETIRHALEP